MTHPVGIPNATLRLGYGAVSLLRHLPFRPILSPVGCGETHTRREDEAMQNPATVGTGYVYFVLATPFRRQHVGWESIRFHGGRYQVFGGIRGPFFINLDRPLTGKIRTK